MLDGAVCILDGVAGVEAQTEKVWMQAGQYNIPRIIFVNKLDREGAAFSRTVKEIGVRLHGWPAVCQIPWWKGGKGDFTGVGDVVHLRGLLWQNSSDGSQIEAYSLEQLEATDKALAEEIKKARVALVELLSEHDDALVELFLEHNEDHLAIPGLQIMQSLRRIILQTPQNVIPVFAGASFRNIGVQPLLDSVVDLLPSPLERPDPEIRVGSQHSKLSCLLNPTPETHASVRQRKRTDDGGLDITEVRNLTTCALAFKVVNDPKRGILVYVRVYSGTLERGNVLYNTNLSVAERVPRILKMYANDAVEVGSLSSGQIGVISGLKFARTGDTLIVYKGLQIRGQPQGDLKNLQLRPITVPPPVFFTSIEPHSLSEQKHVQESLAVLLREDPSLQLSVDEGSGQTHLAGMGDLHLEIARDRLLNDFKAKARISKINIEYREAITSSTAPYEYLLDKPIANKSAKAGIMVALSPLDDHSASAPASQDINADNGSFETTYLLPEKCVLQIYHPGLSRHDSSAHKTHVPLHLSLPSILSAIHAGASAALGRGPYSRFPVSNTKLEITFNASTHLFNETTATAISVATRTAVVASLRIACEMSPPVLMEPVMMATIFVNEASLGAVVQDLSSARGGQIISFDGSDAPIPVTLLTSTLPSINPNHIYAPPDPFADGSEVGSGLGDSQRHIVARVPLKEMVGYLNKLRALTGGRGTFVMNVDGFEKMGPQRQKEVMDAMSEFL